MQSPPLHPSGPRFSRIVYGWWRLADWRLDSEAIADLISTCLDLGITTFDHADIYGDHTCEEIFGRAFSLSGVPRDQVQLVSKCGIRLATPNRPQTRRRHYDTSRNHIEWSVGNSLKNLQTDHLDLLLLHRPDDLSDPDEIAACFQDLRASGKVLHFGVSNCPAAHLDMLQSRLDFPLVTNQIEYSVLEMKHQVDGVIDHCMQHRLRPMAWSPFAGGRVFHGEDEAAHRVRLALHEVAGMYDGFSAEQVALAFILRHPAGFLPILGTGKSSRIRSAVRALELPLDPAAWYQLWEAGRGHPIP